MSTFDLPTLDLSEENQYLGHDGEIFEAFEQRRDGTAKLVKQSCRIRALIGAIHGKQSCSPMVMSYCPVQ